MKPVTLSSLTHDWRIASVHFFSSCFRMIPCVYNCYKTPVHNVISCSSVTKHVHSEPFGRIPASVNIAAVHRCTCFLLYRVSTSHHSMQHAAPKQQARCASFFTQGDEYRFPQLLIRPATTSTYLSPHPLIHFGHPLKVLLLLHGLGCQPSWLSKSSSREALRLCRTATSE
jgi:hypothetical protein